VRKNEYGLKSINALVFTLSKEEITAMRARPEPSQIQDPPPKSLRYRGIRSLDVAWEAFFNYDPGTGRVAGVIRSPWLRYLDGVEVPFDLPLAGLSGKYEGGFLRFHVPSPEVRSIFKGRSGRRIAKFKFREGQYGPPNGRDMPTWP
jgi:hypothetical protein